ncbi:MAG: hypothetical protein ACKFI0_00325 [Candidatus Hodgkinia cicadicola]
MTSSKKLRRYGSVDFYVMNSKQIKAEAGAFGSDDGGWLDFTNVL